jgi:transcriptional regulator with XRE-family HTH domain
MKPISGSAFTALLSQADVSQAGFARLSGVSPRQVNKWCRGRAAVPRWAALLAIALRELSAEALTIMLEELPFASSDGTQPQQ